MAGDLGAIGTPTDSAALGDGSVIGILKQNRTLLTTLAVLGAGGAAFVFASGGELTTAPAKASVLPPVYVEGASVPLSTDLIGNLRTSGGGGGGGNPAGGWLDSVRRVRRIDTLSLIQNLTLVDEVNQIGSPVQVTGVGGGATPVNVAGTVDQGGSNGNPNDPWGVQITDGPTGSILGILTDQPTSRATLSLGVRIIPENYSGVYSFSLVDAAGIAAANNFLCLFNLAGSNDTVVVISAWVNQYSVAVAATKNSVRLTRVTTCTVGTLQAAAAVNKYNTGYPNATSEVRTGNPTVTAAAEVISWPPNENITAAGTTAAGFNDWTPVERFMLLPGQGVVFRQTIAGDVDQTYNFRIAWAERQH